MNVNVITPEVLYAADQCPTFSHVEIAELREKALHNPSGKIRICMHESVDDGLHEMLIALRKGVVFPIHKCITKSETHLIISGLLTMNLFGENGEIVKSIPMGPPDSGRTSYLRIPAGTYHQLHIETDACVFYETKLGPLDPKDSVVAPFDKTTLPKGT